MPMNIYQPQNKTLANLLEMTKDNATILIPDLQRPYVWTPKQVVTLVDSLLRGWPFGSLLLWNLGPLSVGEHLIPCRTFWKIVTRGEGINYNDSNSTFSPASKPNEFFMVLDGQQRLQSLLLAFGSNSSGLRLLDKDWKTSLDGNSPYRGPNVFKHWTKAELYIDLKYLNKSIVIDSDGDTDLPSDVEYEYFLRWAYNGDASFKQHTQNQEPARPSQYTQPLDHVEKGRHIRLGKLWEAASSLMNRNDMEKKEGILKILENHNVEKDLIKRLRNPLRTLLNRLQEAQNQQVQFLQLNPLNMSGYSQQEDYNFAIVNIFTRLNQGGQTLTKEEITFAWIKIQWPEAVEKIEELRSAINEIDSKFRLATDAIVKMLSIIWCAFDDIQRGKILRDNDLLDSKTVKTMARWLQTNWDVVSGGLLTVTHIVSECNLRFNQHYYSINALTLLSVWRISFNVFLFESTNVSAHAKDTFLLNANTSVSEFAKKWLLLSQWAGLWSKGTDISVENYTKKISAIYFDEARNGSIDDVTIKNILNKEIQEWVCDQKEGSITFIDLLMVNERTSVGGYRSALEIWQEQDSDRLTQASILLKTSNSELKKEVDHIVSYKSALEIYKAFPPMGKTLLDTINSIGNCMLLQKTFNISKKDLSLVRWFGKNEFSEIEDASQEDKKFNANVFYKTLAIPKEMSCFDPNSIKNLSDEDRTATIQACIDAIKYREHLIKSGLRIFVDGACPVLK